MRPRRSWPWLAATLALVRVVAAQPAGQAPSQEPPPQQPIFRAGTALVRVDVTVTGRNGEPVVDLQAADFEVEEDGVPQRVETVQFVRLTGERTTDTNEPLEIRGREHARQEAAREDVRLFAIFLDDYHIDKRPEITLPLRDALSGFVQQFGPNDLLVLMEPLLTLDGLRYTRSKPDLLSRIKAFEGRRGEPYPVKSGAEEAQLTQRNWMELRGGVTLSALTALATHLGGLREGRKSILFVSQGPPLGRIGGPNYDRLEEALEAANRGNVTIHALDPRPLGSVGFGGAAVLQRLAGETGGRAMVNTNDPSDTLKEVLAEAGAYYLVGYTPTRLANDGKFHRIGVKVKRRGVDVIARRGYWAASENWSPPGPAGGAAPVNTGLVSALAAMSEAAGGGRAVSVWTGLSRGAGTATRFSVTWEVNPQGLRPNDPKPVRLEVQPVGADGKPSAEAQVIGGAPGELPLIASFEFPAGRQRVRYASQTSTGDTIDRWIQTVTVPALADEPLTLSTPRFLRARSMIEFRAIEANPAPSPAASARFRRNDRVLVDVECHAPDGLAPEVKVDLLNGKGDLLRALEAPALSPEGWLRLTLPVASLASSVYVLRVRVTAGEHTAQQLAAFRVVP